MYQCLLICKLFLITSSKKVTHDIDVCKLYNIFIGIEKGTQPTKENVVQQILVAITFVLV